MDDENKRVCENIGELIKESGLKHKSIAQRCGYTDRQVCDILHGRKVITPSVVKQLCEILKVSPNELFGYDK